MPIGEIESLAGYFENYAGLRELIFKDRVAVTAASRRSATKRPDANAGDPLGYADFATTIGSKEEIKTTIESAPGLIAKHAEFHNSLDVWWKGNVKRLEKLPEIQNVFELRRQCIDGLSKALVPHQLLDVYQTRGAVAAYIKSLESDLKSIAASGWGPELIPDDEILQSQFPEVLQQIETQQTRIAELEGLFAAVSGGDEEDGEVEIDDANGVLPKSLVKSLKEEKKRLLDDVAARGSGHTPNKLINAYWNEGIKWVSLADSDKLDNLCISDTDKTISELGLRNSSAVRHWEGTVILSRDAGIGKSAVITETMAVSQHFMAWYCGPQLINVFLYYWLQFEKPKFEAIAMGSTIKTIGLSYSKKLRIAVPSVREQEMGKESLLAVEERLLGLAEELKKYKDQKTGLMQDLLTGKVRVTVDGESDDE